MRFEYGENHGKPSAIPAHHRAARGAKRGGGDKRLDFHQHGARAFHARKDRRARRLFVAFTQKQFGRVGNLAQAAIGHFKHADFVGWPEAVLHCAQDAIMVPAFALKIENAIDHVFHHARACNLAVLGDMADQDHRSARLLGIADHCLRRGAHLRHRSGRGISHVGP